MSRTNIHILCAFPYLLLWSHFLMATGSTVPSSLMSSSSYSSVLPRSSTSAPVAISFERDFSETKVENLRCFSFCGPTRNKLASTGLQSTIRPERSVSTMLSAAESSNDWYCDHLARTPLPFVLRGRVLRNNGEDFLGVSLVFFIRHLWQGPLRVEKCCQKTASGS